MATPKGMPSYAQGTKQAVAASKKETELTKKAAATPLAKAPAAAISNAAATANSKAQSFDVKKADQNASNAQQAITIAKQVAKQAPAVAPAPPKATVTSPAPPKTPFSSGALLGEVAKPQYGVTPQAIKMISDQIVGTPSSTPVPVPASTVSPPTSAPKPTMDAFVKALPYQVPTTAPALSQTAPTTLQRPESMNVYASGNTGQIQDYTRSNVAPMTEAEKQKAEAEAIAKRVELLRSQNPNQTAISLFPKAQSDVSEANRLAELASGKSTQALLQGTSGLDLTTRSNPFGGASTQQTAPPAQQTNQGFSPVTNFTTTAPPIPFNLGASSTTAQPAQQTTVTQPAVEKKVETPVVEKKKETPVVEKKTETPVVEKKAEAVAPAKKDEKPAVEKKVETKTKEEMSDAFKTASSGKTGTGQGTMQGGFSFLPTGTSSGVGSQAGAGATSTGTKGTTGTTGTTFLGVDNLTGGQAQQGGVTKLPAFGQPANKTAKAGKEVGATGQLFDAFKEADKAPVAPAFDPNKDKGMVIGADQLTGEGKQPTGTPTPGIPSAGTAPTAPRAGTGASQAGAGAGTPPQAGAGINKVPGTDEEFDFQNAAIMQATEQVDKQIANELATIDQDIATAQTALDTGRAEQLQAYKMALQEARDNNFQQYLQQQQQLASRGILNSGLAQDAQTRLQMSYNKVVGDLAGKQQIAMEKVENNFQDTFKKLQAQKTKASANRDADISKIANNMIKENSTIQQDAIKMRTELTKLQNDENKTILTNMNNVLDRLRMQGFDTTPFEGYAVAGDVKGLAQLFAQSNRADLFTLGQEALATIAKTQADIVAVNKDAARTDMQTKEALSRIDKQRSETTGFVHKNGVPVKENGQYVPTFEAKSAADKKKQEDQRIELRRQEAANAAKKVKETSKSELRAMTKSEQQNFVEDAVDAFYVDKYQQVQDQDGFKVDKKVGKKIDENMKGQFEKVMKDIWDTGEISATIIRNEYQKAGLPVPAWVDKDTEDKFNTIKAK